MDGWSPWLNEVFENGPSCKVGEAAWRRMAAIIAAVVLCAVESCVARIAMLMQRD